ncbi:hypothetical protein L0V05_10295 [Tabrizicola sp. J26]|uniref:hypothetical protein n=1 Tax=Alitabrizicola rongguiensis TaxID=2909234 RepID=UPI001F38E636|nr:hypothetical protein [Tabrizicola rongguiensis]MCF1709207.1 hypothetical protein [Tabrizicola rongguiensis]
MDRLRPVFDTELGENVAWRIENMDRTWTFLEPERSAIPQFEYRAYKAPSANWNHDHCAGCNTKLMEAGVPEGLAFGWATVGMGIKKGQKVSVNSKAFLDGSLLIEHPDGAPTWLCCDCHRILEQVRSGKLSVSTANN